MGNKTFRLCFYAKRMTVNETSSTGLVHRTQNILQKQARAIGRLDEEVQRNKEDTDRNEKQA